MRWAGERDGRALLVALAAQGMRTDAPIDMGALVGAERTESDGEHVDAERGGLRAGSEVEGDPLQGRAPAAGGVLPGDVGEESGPQPAMVAPPEPPGSDARAEGNRGGAQDGVPVLRDAVGERLPRAAAVLTAPSPRAPRCNTCGNPRGGGGSACEECAPGNQPRRPAPVAPKETTMTQTDESYDMHEEHDERAGEARGAALARRPDPAPLAARRRLADPDGLAVSHADGSSLATSPTTGKVMAALCSAQTGYERVVKTRKADAGTRGSYSYANLADVAAAVMPSLREAGLFVMQPPRGDVLITRITHGESGEWVEAYMPLIKPDARGGVQALGSALTYTRRYSLVAMLGIVPEDDDDGAQGSGKKAPGLRQRVADLSTWRDKEGARAFLLAEMIEHGVAADIQTKALADFDERASKGAAA